MTLKTRWLAALLGAAFALAGCPTNDQQDGAVLETGPRPDRVVTPDAPATDAPEMDATVTPMDGGGDGAAPDVTPPPGDGGGMWVDGCFVGRPTAMVEFLNRCTTAERARHTPMSPRITADGGVPPLP